MPALKHHTVYMGKLYIFRNNYIIEQTEKNAQKCETDLEHSFLRECAIQWILGYL